MKVTKLDIKKTVLDLPANRPIYSEVERKGWPEAIALKEGEMPMIASANETRRDYQIRKVQMRNGETEYFAIERDETGQWPIYEAIEAGVVESIKTEAYELGKRQGYTNGVLDGKKDGKAAEKRRIRNLSWWKRLTGSF